MQSAHARQLSRHELCVQHDVQQMAERGRWSDVTGRADAFGGGLLCGPCSAAAYPCVPRVAGFCIIKGTMGTPFWCAYLRATVHVRHRQIPTKSRRTPGWGALSLETGRAGPDLASSLQFVEFW